MRSSMIVCMCFGALASPAVVDVSAAQENLDFRKWVDDTGQHSVVAAFVEFQNDHVRLKRKDGQVITVPTTRLSQSDRRYLDQLKLKQHDSGTKKEPASDATGSFTAESQPPVPKAGKCRFEVSGLLHGKMGSMRGDCMDCWNAINAEEEFRPLRRHISASWTGELEHSTDYSDLRKVKTLRRQISTYSQFPLDTDLAPIAKVVAAAKTPHRSARAFYALMYTTPKPKQTKAIQSALATLPGVDARQSTVDNKGIIHVKISGQGPISMTDLVGAIRKAGIQVTTSRGRRE